MKISEKLKIMLKSILSLQMGEVNTDKAVLVFDGEELKEGMDVFVLGEDNEPVPAEDGDYTTEDGKVIKVVEGKVAEIVDTEAEVADEESAEEMVEEVKEEVNEDVDPAEEIVEEVSVEERLASVEERMAAFTDGLNQIINSMVAFEDRIAELEAKLAKVEAPAAEPIDDKGEVEESTHRSKMSYLRKD